MARFAFGKGEKRSYWDIEQLGRTLRSQDVNPVSPRLPGYKQSFTEGTFAEMKAKHTQRKTELAAVHGAPIPVERTHAGLAAAVEAAMKKQLG